MTELMSIETNEITIQEPIALDQNSCAIYLAARTGNSRRTMKYALEKAAQILIGSPDPLDVPWWNLRYQHVAAVRSTLTDSYSPATVNLVITGVRGVLKECWRLNLIPESDYRKAIDIDGVRGERLPAGRALTVGEVTAILGACWNDDSPAGVRDGAIISVLYAAGLRRAEIVGLDIEDYDRENKTLRILGKGNKEREVPLARGAAQALEDWLGLRPDEPGAIFNPVNKGGNSEIRQLAPQAIYSVLKKRAAEAGVENVSPHDLRRTLISHLLDAGADLVTVSKVVGHADVTTTARYDRRGEQAKRQAVDLIAVPTRKPLRESNRDL